MLFHLSHLNHLTGFNWPQWAASAGCSYQVHALITRLSLVTPLKLQTGRSLHQMECRSP